MENIKIFRVIHVTLLNLYQLLRVTYICLLVGLFLARQPPVGRGLLMFEASRSHTTMRHSR